MDGREIQENGAPFRTSRPESAGWKSMSIPPDLVRRMDGSKENPGRSARRERTPNRKQAMSIYDPNPSPLAGRMLSIFRIIAGLMFMSAGTMKLFGFPANPMPNMPPIEWMSQMGIGGMLEVAGGLLIVLGLLTRPTAFILAGEMAVAYFQFHAPQAFWPTTNMGVPAVMYCFFFLYLVVSGAGDWSLDAVIARSRGVRARAGEPSRGLHTAHA
jgi:putative oxidoreductase